MDEELLKKLNYQEGDTILVLNAPEEYLERLAGLAVDTSPEKDTYSFIQVFLYKKKRIPDHFEEGVKNLKKGGKLWFCYAKMGSELKSDITRGNGWDAADIHDFVAVRQVAIDNTWSALRFKPAEDVKNMQQQNAQTEINKDNAVIGKDVDPRQLEIPDVLHKALNENPFCKEFYNSLSYTNRKEYANWIASAKGAETQKKRLKEAIEKLKAGIKNPHQK